MKNQKQSFSISKELKRKRNKAEVKLAEFDNNVMKPFGAWLASFLWNFVRLGVVPFCAAIFLTFLVVCATRYDVTWQSALVYTALTGFVAWGFVVTSLIANYVRAELKYCHQRETARRVTLLGGREVTSLLVDLAAGNDPALEATIRETLGKGRRSVIAHDLGLFLVLPTALFTLAFLVMVSTGMTIGMVGVLAVTTAAFVGLANDRLSHLQDAAYLVMADYAPPTKTLFKR
jgi:hypothetical protein